MWFLKQAKKKCWKENTLPSDVQRPSFAHWTRWFSYARLSDLLTTVFCTIHRFVTPTNAGRSPPVLFSFFVFFLYLKEKFAMRTSLLCSSLYIFITQIESNPSHSARRRFANDRKYRLEMWHFPYGKIFSLSPLYMEIVESKRWKMDALEIWQCNNNKPVRI